MPTNNFPQRITLELTNRCNIACTFCPRHEMGDFLGTMDTKLACRLIDEMAEHLPITLVPFFRGESLLHPDWTAIISYAQKKGIGPIQFATNGTLLDDNNARRLLDCGIDYISFSLDTHNPILYESSRRGASFQKVQENILHFLGLHEATNSTITVQISAVETDIHKAGMDDFVAYWQPKVDRVRVYAEHSADGKPGSMQEHIDLVNFRQPCKKVEEDMMILWNGDIAICNHDWQRQKKHDVFANVATGNIAEAWNCAAYQALRSAHQAARLEGFHPCQDCEQWKAFYLPEHLIGRLYTRAKQDQS